MCNNFNCNLRNIFGSPCRCDHNCDQNRRDERRDERRDDRRDDRCDDCGEIRNRNNY